MKSFVTLFERLDRTGSTLAKIDALVDYFSRCRPADGAWAVHFLAGRRLKRLVKTSLLRIWTGDVSGLDDWLVEASYQQVGDLAETMALLAPPPQQQHELPPLEELVRTRVLALASLDEGGKRELVCRTWGQLGGTARFLYNKLITGALRVGVSKQLTVRALAQVAEVETTVIAHRLMGDWQPDAAAFLRLIDPDPEAGIDASRPYPFFLASPLEKAPESLGEPMDFQIEWKWDGIRAQLIRRDGQSWLWSRGEDRMDGRFPEIEQAARDLPSGTVIDGELVAWRDDQVLPFARLQRRIGRRRPGPRTIRDIPVVLIAYDLLEYLGEDIRRQPLSRRRELLVRLLADAPAALRLEPTLAVENWDQATEWRAQSRQRGVEGLMIKRSDSPYRTGRRRGAWWKWKIEPHTFDGVLIYAQPGHGRRAGLLTDYTFAVHHQESLVPVAKAYSGLSQTEIERLDRWIRANTTERFGPVRAVHPRHVFELAFEGIAESSRHKSGIALRFPRIKRWREDLGLADADHLADLKALLA